MNEAEKIAAAERNAFAEEALAALYFIAAALAFNAGWNIFGWLMVAKGVIDTIAAVLRWSRVRTLRRILQEQSNGE